MRSAFIALLVIAACVGAFSVTGCAESDDSERAAAVAREAETALKESINTETEASTLILRIRMVPESGLDAQDTRRLGAAGLKTLDEADKLRVEARTQLESAQRLYASIDGMNTSDEFKEWVGKVVLFAQKWGEKVDQDEANSALRRKALNMLVDGTADKEPKAFAALIAKMSASSESGQSIMREVNRLSAEADRFAQSME